MSAQQPVAQHGTVANQQLGICSGSNALLRLDVSRGGPPPLGRGSGGRSANAAAAALRLGAARCTRATNLKRAAWWVRARRDALEQL